MVEELIRQGLSDDEIVRVIRAEFGVSEGEARMMLAIVREDEGAGDKIRTD